MVLNVASVGEGPPLLILHGILGQARNWSGIARALSEKYRVLALDLRNHGESPWGEPMDYPTLAGDVAETLDALGLEDTRVIGHSMGGKVTMVLALARAERVRSLVVVDIAPAAHPAENLPLVRALQSVDLAAARRRSDVDAALQDTVPDWRTRAFLLQGLVDGPDGRLAWRHNLEAIERAMPALFGFPDPGLGVAYRGPTLFVAGSRSSYVRPEHQAAIAALFPGAKTASIPEAGHWVHADQPEVFVAVVGEFLGRGRPTPPTSPGPS